MGDQDSIEVTGFANYDVIPDEIYLSVYFKLEEGDNIQEFEFNLSNEIRENGAEIIIFNIEAYDGGEFSGLSKQIGCKIKVDTLDAVIGLINSLKDYGISNLVITNFGYSKAEQVFSKIAKEAFEDAKKKAGIYTSFSDRKLGKVIRIIDQSEPVQQGLFYSEKFNFNLSNLLANPNKISPTVSLTSRLIVCFELL